MTKVKEVELQAIGELRDVSKRISNHLEKKLRNYLSSLSVLFQSRRVLGEYMESAFTEKVVGAEKNFEELSGLYRDLAKETFELPAKLSAPIPNIKNQIELTPWEYLHPMNGNDADRVRVTSPCRWVLSYPCPCDLETLVEARLANENPRHEHIKAFVVQSLTLWMLVDRSPGTQEIFADLHFPVRFETSEVSGRLPYVVVSAEVPTFRPQDSVIQTVTQLSGKRFFEELVDREALGDMRDPLREKLLELAG